MLIIAEHFRDLSFHQLMDVYAQTNAEAGKSQWPEESEYRQLALAEDQFYDYLSGSFFRTPGAKYMIWNENGQYACALRLEPYRDGWLLAGLETRPSLRRMGYAVRLVRAVQEKMQETGPYVLYSHVHKGNQPSLRVHQACGFAQVMDYSVYINGSIDRKAYTLTYYFQNSKKRC